MIKIFCSLFSLFIVSFSIYGQGTQNYDSLKAKCEGPVFTLCEQMPSLRNSTILLEDSLKLYLRNRNVPSFTGVAKYALTISRSGEIEDISLMVTDIDDKNIIDILKKAIKEITNPWIPGKQNSRQVCAYKKMQLYFHDDKIEITFPKF